MFGALLLLVNRLCAGPSIVSRRYDLCKSTGKRIDNNILARPFELLLGVV